MFQQETTDILLMLSEFPETGVLKRSWVFKSAGILSLITKSVSMIQQRNWSSHNLH